MRLEQSAQLPLADAHLTGERGYVPPVEVPRVDQPKRPSDHRRPAQPFGGAWSRLGPAAAARAETRSLGGRGRRVEA